MRSGPCVASLLPRNCSVPGFRIASSDAKTKAVTECSHCRKRYENSVRFCPVDGYAVVPVAVSMLGRTLMGQFQIQSVCGHGATGTVYRATQVGIDREVAVKLLRADLLKDPDVVKRFVREARAGARLNHSNIATVHMVGQTEEGVPFLVMEFVEGEPLSAVLGVDKPLPLRRIVHIGAQIASALAEAHGQGIVHRDLKPENILLTEKRGESEVVKIVDFGIAKMLAHAAPGEDAISRMGTVFGTPHYIAPEQAAGQPVDGRADIYSLGCILFQMATGRVPFDGQQGLQVLLRQVRDPVPDPRSKNPRMSAALAELIRKMLAKDPAARPQTAALVATALREVIADLSSEAEPSLPRSGLKSSGKISSEAPASTQVENWYSSQKSPSFSGTANDDDGNEREAREASSLQAAPQRRRRATDVVAAHSPDKGPRLRHRQALRSGRSAAARSAANFDEFAASATPRTFWQRYWMPIVSGASAIVIGVVMGMLYAHYRVAAPAPALTAQPAAAPPVPAATAVPLIRPNGSARSVNAGRPATLSNAGKGSDAHVPNQAVTAVPPPTGPRPLGYGSTGFGAQNLTTSPATAAPGSGGAPPASGAAGAAPAAVSALAPAAGPLPVATAVPPTPASPGPGALPAAPSAPAATPPASPAPAPPASAAAAPASAPAASSAALPSSASTSTAAPAAPPAAVAPPNSPAPPASPSKAEESSPAPPAKPSDEPEDNNHDPYGRLK